MFITIVEVSQNYCTHDSGNNKGEQFTTLSVRNKKIVITVVNEESV